MQNHRDFAKKTNSHIAIYIETGTHKGSPPAIVILLLELEQSSSSVSTIWTSVAFTTPLNIRPQANHRETATIVQTGARAVIIPSSQDSPSTRMLDVTLTDRALESWSATEILAHHHL